MSWSATVDQRRPDAALFIAAQRHARHEARVFTAIAAAAKLAETPIFFTERFVFKPDVLAAMLLDVDRRLPRYGIVSMAEMKAAGVIK